MKKIIATILIILLGTAVYGGEGRWLTYYFSEDVGGTITFVEGTDYAINTNPLMTFLWIEYNDGGSWYVIPFGVFDLSMINPEVGDMINLRLVNRDNSSNYYYTYAYLGVTAPTPQTPTITTGFLSIVCGTVSYNIVCSSEEYATYYEWSVLNGIIGQGQGTRNISVIPNNYTTGNASARVRARNDDNEWSGYSSYTTATIYRSVTTTTDVTGPDEITVLVQTQYDINALTNATDYDWDITDNSSCIANTTYSNGNKTLKIDWNASAQGEVLLKARGTTVNCGPGDYGNILTVIVSPEPTKPVMSGPNNLCQRVDQVSNYSASSLNATSYNWVLNPGTAGTIAGNGTENISITWDPPYYGSANLTVTAINDHGYKVSDPYAIIMAESPFSYEITGGDGSYCPQTSVPLSVSGHNSSVVSSYTWRVVSGIGIISGTGQNVNLDIGEGAEGTIKVGLKLVGNCGYTTTEKFKDIGIKSLLGPAGTVTGEVYVCEGQSYTFNCSEVDYAVSYDWSINPSNCVVNTVKDGTSVTYTFVSQGLSSAIITATATGQCGDTKQVGTHDIEKKADPNITSFTGQSKNICKNSTVTYTATGNAVIETWGFTFSNDNAVKSSTQSFNEIEVEWEPTYTGSSVIITATAGNGCTTTTDDLEVTFKNIPDAPVLETTLEVVCGTQTILEVEVESLVNIYNWSETSSNIVSLAPYDEKDSKCLVTYSSSYKIGTDIVRVNAQNECGTSSNIEIPLEKNSTPEPVGNITGDNQDPGKCETGKIYSISAVDRADSYAWEIEEYGGQTAGTITQNGLSATIGFNTAYDKSTAWLKVTAVNTCGSTNKTKTLNFLSDPQVDDISGPDEICQGDQDRVYTCSFSYDEDISYEWDFGENTIQETDISDNGDKSKISVTYEESVNGEVTISVYATNGKCNSGSVTKDIDINPLPGTADQPAGDNVVCENVTSSDYTTNPVSNVTGYQWEITPAEAGNITNNGTSATVNWNTGYTVNTQLKVRGTNSCGDGDWSSVLEISKSLIPGTISEITGDDQGLGKCETGKTYSIEPVDRADSYAWTIEEYASQPAGTITQNGVSATIDFNTSYNKSTAWLKVTAVNTCGSTNKTITLNFLSDPQVDDISGPDEICQGDQDRVYTCSFSYNEDISYEWDFGATTIQENDISTNGDKSKISVTYEESVNGEVTISVYATNGKCNSGSVTKDIDINPLPGPANQPVGDNIICENVSSSDYTINPVSDATGYQWEISPGEAGSVTNNGTSATINWNTGYTGNTQLKVKGTNSCGDGNWSSVLEISKSLIPGTISDITGDDQDLGKCETGKIYSIDPVERADSYTWEIEEYSSQPAGTITQNGVSATIDFNTDYTKSTTLLTVTAENTCGSTNKTKTLNFLSDPRVDDISGPDEICQGDQDRVYTCSFSYDEDISYEWNFGATTIQENDISTNGDKSKISVTYEESVNGEVTISVYATNGKCNSGPVTKDIDINPLPGPADKPVGNNIICENVSSSDYTTNSVSDATGYQWELTPAESGSVTNNGTTATIIWSNGYTGNAQLRVRGKNNCGYYDWSDSLTISKTLLPDPGDDLINGPSELCQGSGGVYTINEIYLADSHFWEIYPTNGGTISQEGGNMTIFSASENYYGDVYLKARGVNDCGSGSWSNDYIIKIKRKPILTVLDDHFDICGNGEETEFSNINPKGGKYYYNNNEITSFNPKDYEAGDYNIEYVYTNSDDCSNSKIFTVTLHDPPDNVTLSGVDIYNNKYYVFGLAGESVQISATSGSAYWHDINYSHVITSNILNTSILPDNTQEIKYYFRIKDQYCYSAFDSISTISVITPPTPQITGKETICKNTETVFRAEYDKPTKDYYNYVTIWNVDGKEIKAVDSIIVLADTNKSIRCHLVDSVNTQNGIFLKSGNDIYKSLQQYTVSKPDITGLKEYYCYQDTVEITAASLHTIHWQDGQQTLYYGDTLNIHGITQSATYMVYAIDQDECKSQSEDIVLDVKRVVADFNMSFDQIYVGEKISFTNSTSGALTYLWSFGDNSHDVYDKDPEHFYYTADTYEVNLKSYYDNNCVDSIKKEVTVLSVTGIFNQDDIGIKIYPNPANNILNIEFEKDVKGLLGIYTTKGEKVIEKRVYSRKETVNLSSIDHGVYFMRLTIDNKTEVYKIIKID